MKSVDKCMGEDCICHQAKPVRIITELKMESIVIHSGGSIFPGGGIVQVNSHRPPEAPPGASAMAYERVRRAQRQMRL